MKPNSCGFFVTLGKGRIFSTSRESWRSFQHIPKNIPGWLVFRPFFHLHFSRLKHPVFEALLGRDIDREPA
jgi:hypothetical protein